MAFCSKHQLALVTRHAACSFGLSSLPVVHLLLVSSSLPASVDLLVSCSRCINVLLELIQTKVNYVVQESIIVIKDIFRWED